jgi:hypothetical protein
MMRRRTDRPRRDWLFNTLALLFIAAVCGSLGAHLIESQRRSAPCWDDRYGAELPPLYGTDC